MPRSSQTRAILGDETYKKIRATPVLVVGAGGIGCELLKNLVLVGFANIEIIDLDTIDLSNLNRQFLFRKPDISKSKALVAAATARHFNPSSGINIHARHGNVKDEQNDVEWIKRFGLVMNALDNQDARRHVNRLCQAAGVHLIESGTAGYLGQVTPLLKDRTECFECQYKPVGQKTYPVCTLRATPSEPIHCIVWAKTYLFGKLFGEDDEAVDSAELDKAAAEGENAKEIENLKKEASAFREVRQNLGEEDGPRRVFDKVFTDDINRLLEMDDLWSKPGRVKPVALDYTGIYDGSFSVSPPRPSGATSSTSASAPTQTNGEISNGDGASSSKNAQIGAENGVSLRDQKELSLEENLELFVDSCRRLSSRAIAHPDVLLSFDKDDDDTLDFVLATSNLRSAAYGIPQKTRFQVKEMAGNIIPAIATTNAIVAGYIVMAAVKLLSGNTSKPKKVFLKKDSHQVVAAYPADPPNPHCVICRDVYIPLKVDLGKCTLGQFVNDVVVGWAQAGVGRNEHIGVSNGNGDANGNGPDEVDEDEVDYAWQVYESGRLLADADFTDLYEKTLAEISIKRGSIVTVTDEDGNLQPIHFCICEPEPNADLPYTLPTIAPRIPTAPAKPVPRAETPPDFEEIEAPSEVVSKVSGKKRAADDDGANGDEGGKRRKVQVIDDDDDFEIL